MKRIFTRIALLAIFAGAFMSSCTEDENNEIYNESKKVYYKNPYDYVGVLHNQELDSIACYLGKNLRFNLKDLYEYNVKKSNINEDSISYATYRNEIKQKQNLTYTYLYEDSTILNDYGYCFSYFMNKYRNYMLQVLDSNKDVTPSEFTSNIESIEQEVISSQYFSDTIYSNDVATILSALSIAKYSYMYWYDSYNNSNHPWHKIIKDRLNTLKAKEEEKRGFWDILVTAAKCVVATVATVPADVVGGLLEMEPNPQYPKGGLKGNPGDICNGAIDASSAVWEWAVE